MSVRKLPRELVSLVHHVELNQAGWWDRAIEQLIVAMVWLASHPPTAQEIASELDKYTSAEIGSLKVQSLLKELAESGTLVLLTGDRYKISHARLGEYEKALRDAEDEENVAKTKFIKILSIHCPFLDGQETWRSFNDRCLFPLVQEMGARTYEFLFGGRPNSLAELPIESYLSEHGDDLRQDLRATIIAFLEPSDEVVRSYILRHLNAYFFVEASGLPPETLQNLTNFMKKPPALDLFVDTNFLFSVLGLDEDENPSRQAAEALLALLPRLEKTLRLKLYVAPITVDEATSVLAATSRNLTDVALSPSLARASLKVGLNGIAMKFAQLAARASEPLGAEEYFRPYLEDFVAAARDKGVELYNVKLDEYGMRQDVIDDITEQLDIEKKRQRGKGYAQLRHDMVLWHFVHDQRPPALQSPIEARYWLVTIDFRFLALDSRKKQSSREGVPVCIHPATLIHGLQFWIPRSAELEAAVIGSLRLPFIMSRFDNVSEQVTLRIISTLSRFENVSDLSSDSVASILMNRALRTRFEGEKDVQKQTEIVREGLIEVQRATQAELEAKTSELDRTRKELGDVSQKLSDTETRARSSEEELRSHAAKMAQSRARRDYAVLLVLPLLFGVIALAVGIVAPLAASGMRFSALMAASLGLLFLPWIYLVDLEGEKHDAIRTWQPYRVVHSLRIWIFGAVGTVGLGLLTIAIWALATR